MNSTLIKINLGSGNKHYEGHINIDKNKNLTPDYSLDLEIDKLPFDDNSVDNVIAHHIFEHLGEGFFHCIQELYRVCKHNSIIDIRVPHPRHDNFLIDPTHKRPIYPDTLDMFSQERNLRDINLNGSETPLGLIYNVNFKVISYDYLLDPFWHPKFAQISSSECDYIAKSFNNVIIEILIKLIVIKNEKSN